MAAVNVEVVRDDGGEAVVRKERDTAGNAVVRLSVGGRLFTTTRQTLASCGFFDALLRGPWAPLEDASGAVFVDREGDLFHHVLAHCRGSLHRTVLDRLDLQTRARLIAEASYFQCDGLAGRAVVPPVGAAVRYIHARATSYTSARTSTLAQGTVVGYDAALKRWTVRVDSEREITQASATLPAVQPLGEARTDVFAWPERAWGCEAHCVLMPWRRQFTSGKGKLVPFPDGSGWQWLTSWGHWVSARGVPAHAAADDAFWSFSSGADPPLDEPAEPPPAPSPPAPLRFFPAGAGVGGI